MNSRPPACAQVSSRPTLEADKLGPEEEVPRLENGNDGLVLQSPQLRQHGHVSYEVSQEPETLESADVLPHTFPAENGAHLKEPLQDDIWALVDAMPFETSAEIEEFDIVSELTEAFDWDVASAGYGARSPKEPLQDHVPFDSLETTNAGNARESKCPGRMEKRTKRARGLNWNHAHTMALAELKREASLNKEYGPLMWERIAQTLSSRFPDQIRTGAQCRRRWDTLVKVYNHIEDYCVETGAQDHRELDEGELASMKLDTAYQQDWYDIVEQVCSQRKRKERCDRELMLTKRSKDSHSVELPERVPTRDTLCSASTSKSVTHHEQSTPESTTTYAQVSSSPSLEADKLGPEEKVPRLKIGNDGLILKQSTTACAQVSSSPSIEVDKLSPEEEVLRHKNGNDGLMFESTQLRQHGHVSHGVSQEPQTLESANVLPHSFPVENGAQLQDDFWALIDDMPFEYDLSSWLELPDEWSSRSSASDRSRRDTSPSTSVLPDSGIMYEVSIANDIKSSRWSLKVILLKIRRCCYTCGRKKRTEDMEMESKQAARLKEKARKKSLMPRKENVPAMSIATSATRANKPLQKDTERISKQAASDKKEEETMPRKAERQQLGGKSSSKCLPVGKLCAKWSRKLFPAFRDQSSH